MPTRLALLWNIVAANLCLLSDIFLVVSRMGLPDFQLQTAQLIKGCRYPCWACTGATPPWGACLTREQGDSWLWLQNCQSPCWIFLELRAVWDAPSHGSLPLSFTGSQIRITAWHSFSGWLGSLPIFFPRSICPNKILACWILSSSASRKIQTHLPMFFSDSGYNLYLSYEVCMDCWAIHKGHFIRVAVGKLQLRNRNNRGHRCQEKYEQTWGP